MKKTLTLILAMSMVLSLASVAFAASREKWDSDIHDSTEYFKYDGFAYEYEDFFEIDSTNDNLVPGNDYYFDITIDRKPVTDDFFKYYTAEVKVGTAYPKYTRAEREAEEKYLSSTSAEKLVKKAELAKLDGKYYLHVEINKVFPYTNEKDLKVYVVAEDKENPVYRSRSDLVLTVGYTKNGTAETVDSDEYTVDNDAPIVEFSEDLGNCRIEMEDGSIYEAKLSKSKPTKANLHHSTQPDSAVKIANPNAKMNFLSFTATPDFTYTGRLFLRAPAGMNYAYEINNDGSLTKIGAAPKDGYIAVVTDRLGSYVVSNVSLKNASAVPSVPSTPSVPSVPSAGGNVPFNPGTGAAI